MFEIRRILSAEDLVVRTEEEQASAGLRGDITRDSDGHHVAVSTVSGMTAVIREDGGGRGRMFNRRAVKFPPGEPSRHLSVLVLELDGVRVYINEHTNTILMTKEDLAL